MKIHYQSRQFVALPQWNNAGIINIRTGTRPINVLRNILTDYTVKDTKSTDHSRLCKYAVFLIFYISPINIIFIRKIKTPKSVNLIATQNYVLANLNYIETLIRRKYELYEKNLAKYQLLLYEIGFKKCSSDLYSEYNSFHKSYVAKGRFHCSYSSTKVFSKITNKSNITNTKTRSEWNSPF